MNSVIDAQPTILFDEELSEVKNPRELKVGNFFYISQSEPLASGEPARNPFDIPPNFLEIPEIQNTSIPEADLLLIRVTEIHNIHTGTCRVEAEIDDAEKVLRNYKRGSNTLSNHDYKIRNTGYSLDSEDIRGSMNKIINQWH